MVVKLPIADAEKVIIANIKNDMNLFFDIFQINNRLCLILIDKFNFKFLNYVH